MAQGTDRAPFPDNEHPLHTPNAGAQRQVVARIAQAREGKRTRKGSADFTITQRRGLPMGQHPRVGRKVLAAEWGVGHTKADELAAHPEKLDPWQVRQLCELCGVTLEWLRGWEDVNAYGQYETADTVAAMYSHLTNEDRALACDLLARLLGADAVRAIKHEQWERDNREWLERNPEKAREIAAMVQKATQAVASSMTETIRAAMGTATEAVRTVMEPLQEAARAIKDRYTADEWELMRKTADELQAQGEDTNRMTPDELLARARGDSVEDYADAAALSATSRG